MANKPNNKTGNNKSGAGKPAGKQNRGKGGKPGGKVVREQPSADSKDPRINLDNARVDKVESEIKRDAEKPNANHITDFNKNAELLRSAASLPFASILGQTLTPSAGNAVPGITTVLWNPSFGSSSVPSAWNKAGQQIYSFVVHANSRNYKYGFTDLFMLIHAGIELFVAIADAIRAYGIIKYYPERNYYLADGLVKAIGYDPADLRRNLSSMWFDINNLIMQTKQIWIPNVLPLLQRWIRMNSTVYTDAPGDASQMYVYVRNRYFKMSETASTQGTCLVPATIPTTIDQNTGAGSSWTEFYRENGSAPLRTYKWEQMRAMIQSMISALVMSQDRGMIYGDILNAYGDAKIYAMPEINVDYVVKPEYNAEVLAQIENITFCNYNYPRFFTQNLDNIGEELQQVWVAADHNDTSLSATAMMPREQILNFHVAEQPSTDLITVGTRLKVGAGMFQNTLLAPKAQFSTSTGAWTSVETEKGTAWLPTTCGTEIPCAMYITQAVSPNNNISPWYIQRINPIFSGSSQISGYGWLRLMAFDWHPFIYDIRSMDNIGSGEEVGDYASIFAEAYGDFSNYIAIDDVNLAKLNDVCLYSVLGIPQM